MPGLAHKSSGPTMFQIVSLTRGIAIESGFESKTEALDRRDIVAAMPFYAGRNVVVRQWNGREFIIVNEKRESKDTISDVQYAASRRTARALTYRIPKLRAHMDFSISQQAKAEPSDPFTEDRVRAYFREGIAELADFNVRFRKEERVTEKGNKYTVEVPYGQVRM